MATSQSNRDRVLGIIVADDDDEMRSYYLRTIPLLGHEVLAAAATGLDLLEYSVSHEPDLVVTDIQMPTMSGLEAIERMDDNIPFVVVSARDPSEEWANENSDRLIAYLVKPIGRRDLDEAFRRAVALLEDDVR